MRTAYFFAFGVRKSAYMAHTASAANKPSFVGGEPETGRQREPQPTSHERSSHV